MSTSWNYYTTFTVISNIKEGLMGIHNSSQDEPAYVFIVLQDKLIDLDLL